MRQLVINNPVINSAFLEPGQHHEFTGATFNLTLQQTYFRMGFFNIGVGYDRYVRQMEGPVRFRLGRDGAEIEARVDRHANQNGTPRIMGGAQLKRWFQANFKPMDTVAVAVSSQDVMILDRK